MREASEIVKVGFVGFAGSLATLKLADVATLVSIAVGLATLAYVCMKIYYLHKNRGRPVE